MAAVIGSPVGHSLSPAIHNAAFSELGVDWSFAAFDVAAGGASAALAAMKALGIGGYAVTTPLKQEMAAAVDRVDAAAEQLGSVNTVVLNDDGSTFGTSTDGDGFVASLRHHHIDLAGKRTVVLGAGGAGRSIVEALGRAGVAEIAIVNRTHATAERAAALAPQTVIASATAIADADIVINTTSIGMGNADATPIEDRSLLHSDLIVCDIVYHPLETRLLRDARTAGARVVDGLSMLVGQAALQQQLWCGEPGCVETMRAAAQAELRDR